MTAVTEELDDEQVLMAAALFALRRHLAAHPGAVRHRDDRLSDACFGAATAYSRYDPAGGASLFTFALQRATGAITDGVRQRSPMTRGEYAADPDPAAVVAQRTPASLDELAEHGWNAPSPRESFEQSDDHDQVVQLLASCSPSEQLILTAVVMYGFSQTDVAAWLGLNVSRVNQIQHRALARLRGAATGGDGPWVTEPLSRKATGRELDNQLHDGYRAVAR